MLALTGMWTATASREAAAAGVARAAHPANTDQGRRIPQNPATWLSWTMPTLVEASGRNLLQRYPSPLASISVK